MNKEFIPYEQSLALKELGFDEPCFGKYLSSLQSDWKVYELILEMGMNEEFEDNRNVYLSEGACSAPTFSQCFRWFREKFDLHNGIYPYYDEYEFQIKDFRLPTNIPINGGLMPYEEAELECLIKLIKIVKNK